VDADGDGWPEGEDCDDHDAAINPDAQESCDGVDDDCGGEIDEDATDAATWYADADADADADGYGDPSTSVTTCEQGDGWVADASDCDDGDAAVYPGADEYCDGVDSDCDGSTDDGDEVDVATWYADADLDGYGDATTTTAACEEPSGYTDDSADCDDADADINPGASEACNGLDDDCDGTVDNDSAVGGDSAGCPADDCAAILVARPGATDGAYWVDPAAPAPPSRCSARWTSTAEVGPRPARPTWRS
jgi:hypothetical protein